MKHQAQIPMHIARVDRSATEHFLAEALTMRILAVHGAFECDIDGALEAGQYGLAFVATRGAFHLALNAYLAREGLVRALPDLRDPSGKVFEVLQLREGDSELWNEAWAIECANPASDEEVVEYVARYRRFFKHTLNVDEPSLSGALLSDAVYANYLRYTDELSQVLDYLGIAGIVLPDVQARRSRRTAIKQRLDDAGPENDDRRGDSRDSGPMSSDHERSVDIRVTLPVGTLRVIEQLLTDQIAALKTQASRTTGREERRDLLIREQACETLLQHLHA